MLWQLALQSAHILLVRACGPMPPDPAIVSLFDLLRHRKRSMLAVMLFAWVALLGARMASANMELAQALADGGLYCAAPALAAGNAPQGDADPGQALHGHAACALCLFVGAAFALPMQAAPALAPPAVCCEASTVAAMSAPQTWRPHARPPARAPPVLTQA